MDEVEIAKLCGFLSISNKDDPIATLDENLKKIGIGLVRELGLGFTGDCLGYANSSKSNIIRGAIIACPLEEGSQAFKGIDSADSMHGLSLSHADILMVVDDPDSGIK
ncbi:hypothetical protein ACOSQ2_022417 [Xanthoceras sorbifolium]